jgi:hypothetical protein
MVKKLIHSALNQEPKTTIKRVFEEESNIPTPQLRRAYRWNSWTGYLVEISGRKLKSSQNRVFVWVSALIYRSTKCYSWTDSNILFWWFFCKDFYSQRRVWLKSSGRRRSDCVAWSKSRVFCLIYIKEFHLCTWKIIRIYLTTMGPHLNYTVTNTTVYNRSIYKYNHIDVYKYNHIDVFINAFLESFGERKF